MKNTKLKSSNVNFQERYIIDKKGSPEFVVLPFRKYKKMLDLLEDYGLVKAIKEVEKQKKYSLEVALKMLDD